MMSIIENVNRRADLRAVEKSSVMMFEAVNAAYEEKWSRKEKKIKRDYSGLIMGIMLIIPATLMLLTVLVKAYMLIRL